METSDETDLVHFSVQNIEKVIFQKRYCEEHREVNAWKRFIRHLPNVKDISYRTRCNDDVLRCIAHCCPKLETLDVTNSRGVTDTGVKYFCQGKKRNREGECLVQAAKVPCPNLKTFLLDCTFVAEDGIKQLLITLPSLERIDSPSLPYLLCRIHNFDFGSFYKTDRLTYLKLSECGRAYDDVLESSIALCPNLKSFSCKVYKPAHLNLLSSLHSILNLDLDFDRDRRITAAEMLGFLKEQGGKITSLTFRRGTAPLTLVAQYCPRLNELALQEVIIEYNEKGSAPFSNSLRFTLNLVDLYNSSNCAAICSILRSSPAIKGLILLSCFSFPPEIETAILKCCKQRPLKYLEIGRCWLSEEFLTEILVTCTTLETLTLNGDCGLSYEFVGHLYRFVKSLPNLPLLKMPKR